MRIATLLLSSLLAGCFVVPAKTTTTRDLGTERSATRKGIARGLTLTTEVDHTDVIMRVIRTRECHREVSRITEVTEHRHLKMGGVEDPRGAPFAAILAPVTLPISLLISGISVAANSTNRYEQRKVIGVETSECKEPADGVPVEITLASGLSFTRASDTEGKVMFRLPSGEPYRGVIHARAESQTTQLKYKRKAPGVTTVRDAVTSCAHETAFSGALEVRVDVNPEGMPTRVALDHGDPALTTCITTHIADARFPQEQRDTTLVLPFFSLGE